MSVASGTPRLSVTHVRFKNCRILSKRTHVSKIGWRKMRKLISGEVKEMKMEEAETKEMKTEEEKTKEAKTEESMETITEENSQEEETKGV